MEVIQVNIKQLGQRDSKTRDLIQALWKCLPISVQQYFDEQRLVLLCRDRLIGNNFSIHVICDSGRYAIEVQKGAAEKEGLCFIPAQQAKQFCTLFEELKGHIHDVLQPLAELISSDSQPDLVQPAPSRAEKVASWVKDKGNIVGDVLGITRNALDVVRTILTINAAAEKAIEQVDRTAALTAHATSIVQAISSMRIVQGCLSILTASIKMHSAVQELHAAQECYDEEGVELAQMKIAGAALGIAEGIFWIVIGSICLANPELAVTVTTLQFLLFYGGFMADAAVGVALACRTKKGIETHYRPFRDILQMPEADREKAARRFLDRMWTFTVEDEGFAKNSLSRQKLLRYKRAIAARMGLTQSLYDDVVAGRKAAVVALQEALNGKMAEQNAQIALLSFCLAVNVLSLQVDLPGLTQFPGVPQGLTALYLGMRPEISGIINSSLWVLVNAGFLAEDLPKQYVTQLFNRFIPTLPRPRIRAEEHSQVSWRDRCLTGVCRNGL